MPLLQGTLFAAVFLIPGVFSLALALAPRGRAIRHSSLSTRAFGLIFFSVTDWALAVCLYEVFVRDCGPTLATLLISPDHQKNGVVADLLTFPRAVWIGGVLMVVAIVVTGGAVGMFHSAALTGMAVHDYRLKCNLAPCSHSWPVRMLTAPAVRCPRCRHRWWVRASQCIDWLLRHLGLTAVFQPLGAGYWLVIQKAAQVLQWSSEDVASDDRIARVYVDVVQGDENSNGKIGVLFKGTVKHLVCETDGNIVFLLLDDAGRWRGTKERSAGDVELVVPDNHDRPVVPRSPWNQIEKSAAFAIEGKSIRNISFRLVDRFSMSVSKDEPWQSLKQALS